MCQHPKSTYIIFHSQFDRTISKRIFNFLCKLSLTQTKGRNVPIIFVSRKPLRTHLAKNYHFGTLLFWYYKNKNIRVVDDLYNYPARFMLLQKTVRLTILICDNKKIISNSLKHKGIQRECTKNLELSI